MRRGFTLAEVLITLGIIGVVAAMTIPALIGKYEKNIALVRLERSFNILSNALVAARVDNGDPVNWSFDGAGIEFEEVSAKNAAGLFINKYITPYIAKGYKYDDVTLADCGYKSPMLYRNGKTARQLNTKYAVLTLNDGTHVIVGIGVSLSADGAYYTRGINFYVDINGPKGPNRFGNDIFMTIFPFTTNANLYFYRPFQYRFSNNSITLEDLTKSRDELIQGCKNDGKYCGALIQKDGWKFNDDYPW